MRKTLLITMDYLPDTGGVAIYWSELAKHLPDDKFLILAPIVTASKEGGETNVARIKFFNQWLWPHWLLLLIKSAKIIKEQGIELIIAGQILPVGTVCYLLKKIGLIRKYQVSCHGMDLAVLRGRKRKLAKSILASADKVIVNSDFTKDLASDLGVVARRIYKVRPCPRQLPSTSVNIKERFKLNLDNMILTVARLVPRKGIDMVIKALPQVWQVIPEAVYFIVGAGPDRQRLELFINEHIDAKNRNKIIFVGRVAEEELAAYYQAAKIFIMPTRAIAGDVEGLGIVYLEAGLFKLPVIASPVGGVEEAVKNGETGIFVNSFNSHEIAAAIVKLLKDDQYRLKLGNNNYNWAKGFNWANEANILANNL